MLNIAKVATTQIMSTNNNKQIFGSVTFFPNINPKIINGIIKTAPNNILYPNLVNWGQYAPQALMLTKALPST